MERRARYDLEKTETRLHIVEGYLAVQAAPDAVVAAIRAAPDSKAAQLALCEKPFWLSEKQAEAILAMPLRRLTGLERDKLNAEETELSAKVKDLTGLLGDTGRVIATIIDEAEELSNMFGIDRRTAIDRTAADAAASRSADGDEDEDGDSSGGSGTDRERARDAATLFAKRSNVTVDSLNKDNLVIMTNRGYIKRIDPSTFSKQNRATRGKNMGKMRGGDEVTKATHCGGLDTVLFFTDRGRVHAVSAYTIPEASTTALGTPFTRVLKLTEGENITAMLPVSSADEGADISQSPHSAVLITALYGVHSESTTHSYPSQSLIHMARETDPFGFYRIRNFRVGKRTASRDGHGAGFDQKNMRVRVHRDSEQRKESAASTTW